MNSEDQRIEVGIIPLDLGYYYSIEKSYGRAITEEREQLVEIIIKLSTLLNEFSGKVKNTTVYEALTTVLTVEWASLVLSAEMEFGEEFAEDLNIILLKLFLIKLQQYLRILRKKLRPKEEKEGEKEKET